MTAANDRSNVISDHVRAAIEHLRNSKSVKFTTFRYERDDKVISYFEIGEKLYLNLAPQTFYEIEIDEGIKVHRVRHYGANNGVEF